MCLKGNKLVLVLNSMLIILHVFCQNVQGEDEFIKVIVKIKAGSEDSVLQTLERQHFLLLRKVTQSSYTFVKQNAGNVSDSGAEVASLREELVNKIEYIVRSQELFLQLPPTLEENHVRKTSKVDNIDHLVQSHELFLHLSPTLKGNLTRMISKADINPSVCPPMFDQLLGVDATWEQGITGKGVVVAVTDIGIDPDQPDLKSNIDFKLSYNFVDDSNDFSPETFPQILSSTGYTNHGNACAGLVGGKRRNERCQLCGSGVAPNARIVAQKVCFVKEIQNRKLWFYMDDETLSQAFVHGRDEIDIFSCSLNHKQPFQDTNIYMKEVLYEGYLHGRKGKGNIFVFPAYPPGNGYTNNFYTIGVEAIGVHGGLSSKSQPNSAVLVSVFGYGRQKHQAYMLTLTHTAVEKHGIKCEINFGGSSAATAILSGMIALAKEANPELTARDIKHLLVKSSNYTGLTESSYFKQNAAGFYYHDVFGFGYPVASIMITLAMCWKQLPKLLSNRYTLELNGHHGNMVRLYVGCHRSCNCIEKTEQVIVNVTFRHPTNHNASIVAVSPSGTRSVLFERMLLSDDLNNGSITTTFLSNHFWGEDANGIWLISLTSDACSNIRSKCSIRELSVSVYGTGSSCEMANTTLPCTQHCEYMSTEFTADKIEINSELGQEEINVSETQSFLKHSLR